MLIRFTRGTTPYLSGETASFDDAKAAAFVSSGRAEYVTKPVAAETPGLQVITKTDGEDAGGQAPAGDAKPAVPAGWRDLHHIKMIPLAKQFDESVSTKAHAIAVLEAAEKAAVEAQQA